MKKRKKRALTLIEMIVVMLLIAMITGAVAYNYNESLNEGKAFKTKEGIARIETILALEMAENNKKLDEVIQDWQGAVKRSPLVGKNTELIKDGWGEEYIVSVKDDKEEISVKSHRLDEYQNRKKNKK